MRINIGCGQFPLAGHINIDLFPPADVVGDFRLMQFQGVESVVMFHVLEHLPRRESCSALRHVREWLRPGGQLTVEVPDMEAILDAGTENPDWQQRVYGEQSHPGEYHMTGFTLPILREIIAHSGYVVTDSALFLSWESQRVGFPCIKVQAIAS